MHITNFIIAIRKLEKCPDYGKGMIGEDTAIEHNGGHHFRKCSEKKLLSQEVILSRVLNEVKKHHCV